MYCDFKLFSLCFDSSLLCYVIIYEVSIMPQYVFISGKIQYMSVYGTHHQTVNVGTCLVRTHLAGCVGILIYMLGPFLKTSSPFLE